MNKELYGGYRIDATPTGLKFIVPYRTSVRGIAAVVGLALMALFFWLAYGASPSQQLEATCGQYRDSALIFSQCQYRFDRAGSNSPATMILMLAAGFAAGGVMLFFLAVKPEMNLGKSARIELRPDAIVLDDRHSFRREDINALTFGHDSANNSDSLNIVYGVRDIALVKDVDPAITRIFRRDFEQAQRRLWHMLD